MPMLLPPPLLLLLLPTHDALPIQELKNFLKLLYSLSTRKIRFNNLHEQFQSRNIPIRSIAIAIATAVRVTHNLDKTNDIIAFKFVLL
jgi:hypothetical protein